MDQWTGVDYATVGIAAAAAVIAGIEMLVARGARKDAAQASADAAAHEEAAQKSAREANAARAEASSALTEIASVMRDQAESEPKWEPQTHGGGHVKWDMVNHTGKIVMARLVFPDQGPGHQLKASTAPIFDSPLDPGEALEFTWERRGPGTGRSIMAHVLWSDLAGSREVLTKVRVTMPD